MLGSCPSLRSYYTTGSEACQHFFEKNLGLFPCQHPQIFSAHAALVHIYIPHNKDTVRHRGLYRQGLIRLSWVLGLSLLPCFPPDIISIAHLGRVVNTFLKSFSTFFEGADLVPLCPRDRGPALYKKGPPPPSLLYHTKSIVVKGFLKKIFIHFSA